MIYSDFKHFLPYSGITVGFGFCPRHYSVTENAGRVTITIEILKGTPARDVIVTVQTVDSSARGMAPKQCNGALKQWWLNKLDCVLYLVKKVFALSLLNVTVIYVPCGFVIFDDFTSQ